NSEFQIGRIIMPKINAYNNSAFGPQLMRYVFPIMKGHMSLCQKICKILKQKKQVTHQYSQSKRITEALIWGSNILKLEDIVSKNPKGLEFCEPAMLRKPFDAMFDPYCLQYALQFVYMLAG
ncbi:hypothetical protein ACJX0J_027604, partial [Zea mays]